MSVASEEKQLSEHSQIFHFMVVKKSSGVSIVKEISAVSVVSEEKHCSEHSKRFHFNSSESKTA